MELLSQLAEIFTSPGFYAAAIRLTTPLLLTAMGALLCERAGVLTIATEGWMLSGAMTGVVVSYYSGNPWIGALAAMLAALVAAFIFAVFVIDIGTDQIVTGVALNLGALGATSLIFRQIFGPMSRTPTITGLPTWPLPGLSQIPLLGEVLFDQSPLVYVAFLLIPITHFIMFQTTWGLQIRAVGESPRVGDTVGVNIFRVRYLTILYAGLLAGLSGAFLSLGQTTIFQEGMTAGRGYIAYTAIVFGKWTPLGTSIGAMIFGLADAFQLRVQALGIGLPYQFALMIPYILTIVAIVVAVGRTAWPAAYSLTYRRSGR
ncbi:MAG: ABC transporter permease [Anaerolineae bacterium]